MLMLTSIPGQDKHRLQTLQHYISLVLTNLLADETQYESSLQITLFYYRVKTADHPLLRGKKFVFARVKTSSDSQPLHRLQSDTLIGSLYLYMTIVTRPLNGIMRQFKHINCKKNPIKFSKNGPTPGKQMICSWA